MKNFTEMQIEIKDGDENGEGFFILPPLMNVTVHLNPKLSKLDLITIIVGISRTLYLWYVSKATSPLRSTILSAIF